MSKVVLDDLDYEVSEVCAQLVHTHAAWLISREMATQEKERQEWEALTKVLESRLSKLRAALRHLC
jgi:hypothetical protein